MVVAVMYYVGRTLQKATIVTASMYKVKLIRLDNGDPFPVLTCGKRPLALPSLWADDLSLTARFNTIHSYLTDVVLIYQWAMSSGVNLHERLSTNRILTKAETRSLALALASAHPTGFASTSTCDRRLQAARSFLTFGIDLYIDQMKDLSAQAQAEKNKAKLLSRLTKQLTKLKNLAAGPSESTALSSTELRILSSVMHPASDANPFHDNRTKIRNYCLLHVAIETWARRAEIVLLEVGDVHLGLSPTITIKEPSRNNAQKRMDGASLKTRGRIVPITDGLSALLQAYVDDVRDSFLRPRRPTMALFISGKDGRRLASGTLNTILRRVQAVPEVTILGKRIHPHGLRASGANAFRRHAGAPSSRLTAEEFRDCITYIGGWSPDSKMVQRYTRQAISERASQLVRKGFQDNA